jgi:hypothetical protein
VLDGVKTKLAVSLDQPSQIGSDELSELPWTDEGTFVETIIRA